MTGTTLGPAPSTRAAAFLLVGALLLGCAGCSPAAPPSEGRVPAPAVAPDVEVGYVPPPAGDGGWERRDPADVGMDPALLEEAAAWAVENESDFGPDIGAALQETLSADEWGEIVGPVAPRGGPSGIVLRGGYIVAEWGDTRRADMTFSVTKSYLSDVAGLAWDAGLVEDVHDPIARYAPNSLFTGRNAPITWHMLLQQRSEWEGSLWGKPDVADRRRGRDRELREPGTFWEYNDVRVNLAALALLHVWDRPLPDVLRDRIMDPIGASPGWEWHGYRTSWLTLDGEGADGAVPNGEVPNGDSVQSVSGGGHWGGGLWISARDHARFGLLHAREGLWGDRRLLSEEWIRMATEPAEIRPDYGYMWWLNTDRALFPSAPETSYFALGGGTNVIWIDPELDLVAVVRWIETPAFDGFVRRVLESMGIP